MMKLNYATIVHCWLEPGHHIWFRTIFAVFLDSERINFKFFHITKKLIKLKFFGFIFVFGLSNGREFNKLNEKSTLK